MVGSPTRPPEHDPAVTHVALDHLLGAREILGQTTSRLSVPRPTPGIKGEKRGITETHRRKHVGKCVHHRPGYERLAGTFRHGFGEAGAARLAKRQLVKPGSGPVAPEASPKDVRSVAPSAWAIDTKS